jgi:Family of unknown function (DUF6515)
MKKVFICLMISVYFLGTFSTAFGDSRSHKKQSRQKSGHRAHKPNAKSGVSTGGSRTHRPHGKPRISTGGSRTHRPHGKPRISTGGPRTKAPAVRHKSRPGHRGQRKYSGKRHRPRPSFNRPHRFQKHQPRSRVHKPRFTKKYRPNSHVYRSRSWRKYRPFPRVHYGHRHPHGHRVHVLPHGFISFSISGLIYYYASGNYYRDYGGYYTVVTPPIGALITVPPPGYRIVYIDSHPYYLAGGIYYVWDDIRRGYRVVPPPEVIYESSEEAPPETLASSLKLFVYPRAGQSENEQGNDRYDCHLWAVGETDFDPTLQQSSSELERSDYKRAITACLEAREYTVE